MCASSASTTTSYVPGQPIDRSGNTEYYWKDPTLSQQAAGENGKLPDTYMGQRVSAATFAGLAKAESFRTATAEEKQSMIDSGEVDPYGPSYSRMIQFVGDFGKLYDPENPIFAAAPRKYETELRDGYRRETDVVSKEYKEWVKQTKIKLKYFNRGSGPVGTDRFGGRGRIGI